METVMETNPRKSRLAQLMLFGERVTLPRWHDLSEESRTEIVRLLAQLLRDVRTRAEMCGTGGRRDE
jgi:hypothetical protein